MAVVPYVFLSSHLPQTPPERTPTGRFPKLSRLHSLVGVWYTYGMKTGISLPNLLFHAADALARTLGMTRSRLFSTAIAEFVARHRMGQVTARLDAVYSAEDTGLDPGTREAQRRAIRRPEW